LRPTDIPTPVPTEVPLQPFSDDFGSGPNSAWNVLSGSWITTGGRYTTIGSVDQFQDYWLWSVLDGASWRNYRVKVDYKINYPYSANQGQIAIAVRMGSGQRLAFVVDVFMRAGWGFIDSNTDNIQYVGTDYGKDVPPNGTILLEASGNDFTGYVNGTQIQTLNLSGFESGGVGLGVYCHIGTQCPSFDNFSVQPIQ
jgi:hypothetical protein